MLERHLRLHLRVLTSVSAAVLERKLLLELLLLLQVAEGRLRRSHARSALLGF